MRSPTLHPRSLFEGGPANRIPPRLVDRARSRAGNTSSGSKGPRLSLSSKSFGRLVLSAIRNSFMQYRSELFGAWRKRKSL